MTKSLSENSPEFLESKIPDGILDRVLGSAMIGMGAPIGFPFHFTSFLTIPLWIA